MNEQIREAERLRYRTYIQAGGFTHPTFDIERYYTEMSTREITALRDKTVCDLKKDPSFAPKFYREFAEYLNHKLAERKTFRDWIWRHTILRFNLLVWKLKI